MKKFSISVILSMLLIVIFVTSCTIQKRRYMPGYHIDRIGSRPVAETKSENKNFNKTADFVEVQKQKNVAETNKSIEEPLLYASDDDLNIIPQESENSTLVSKAKNDSKKLVTTSDIECDIIILKNGDEISAKVLEVNQYEVKYLMCDNIYGPTFTVNKSEIFKINFSNGTSTVFTQPNSNRSNDNDSIIPKSNNPKDKSLVVAIVLWFFLGLLGIHRFYLGHIGMGILYLLTGALCGIGWIIDIILLVTGGLQPKEGKYID